MRSLPSILLFFTVLSASLQAQPDSVQTEQNSYLEGPLLWLHVGSLTEGKFRPSNPYFSLSPEKMIPLQTSPDAEQLLYIRGSQQSTLFAAPGREGKSLDDSTFIAKFYKGLVFEVVDQLVETDSRGMTRFWVGGYSHVQNQDGHYQQNAAIWSVLLSDVMYEIQDAVEFRDAVKAYPLDGCQSKGCDVSTTKIYSARTPQSLSDLYFVSNASGLTQEEAKQAILFIKDKGHPLLLEDINVRALFQPDWREETIE